MAEQKPATLRVGILIAVALAIFAVAILSIGHGTRFFAGAEDLEAHFQRINGLQVGAPVTLTGVNIGAVDSIKFPPDPRANYVIVRLWIDKAAAPRIRVDSVARIESLGLLGDRFVGISSGSPNAPPITPGNVLKSQDPINYAALLERKGTTDTFANVIAITESMKSLADAVANGHGLVHDIFYGPPPESREKALTLASIRATVDTTQQTAAHLDQVVQQMKSNRSLFGALTSEQGRGRQLVANLQASAASLRQSTEQINRLVTRYQNANGAIPQLMEDRQYAQEVMGNLRQSSSDLEQIMHKINSGQGTAGKLVNDPKLYDSAQALLSSNGWGIKLMKGLYSVTHPLSSSAPNPGNRESTLSQTNEQSGSSPPARSFESHGSSATQNPDGTAKSTQ
jgi:phospholipid/cholesterol/gamma-HCH transport system substrate-binding protein